MNTLLQSGGLLRRPQGMIGGFLTALMLLAALVGTLHTPYDPILMDLGARLQPPSLAHWLGTDEWGRDVFSRLIAGASVSLRIGIASVTIAIVGGTTVGALAGFIGGWSARITMALMDALQAFPSLVLALCVMAFFGPSLTGVVVALSLTYLPSVVRIVRASTLSLREKEYVDASRVMGNSAAYTLSRHVLPNAFSPIAVLATAMFGWAILSESALSFLGLGVPPPAASWGGMLADSRTYFESAPWLAIAPGLAISITLLGINLLGDALRDHFDPRMRNL